MKTLIRKMLGPKSKYDPAIPYTYMAKINVFHGSDIEPLYIHCFADTLCGLVDYLSEYNVGSEEVDLFEINRSEEKSIKKEFCLDKSNRWLRRPAICHSLEKHYQGHIDEKRCSFRDRDRRGAGLL